MKKIYLNTLWGRLGIALLFLITALIIHSCRKDAKLTQQQINDEIAAANFPVTDAKAWFNGNKTALATKVKINSDASFLNLLANFTPVWDSARTAVDTNYYVVEAPARYALGFGFATDSTTANINGLTRLLVLKSKKYGSLNAVLMHVHGNTGIDISNVHYMAVPATFSGNVFYTSLQGAFMCGYIYTNGKVTKVSSGSASTTKPAGPQILKEFVPDDGGCTTVETRWDTRTCYWNADDTFDHCTTWIYVYSTYEIYCESGGGGNGGAPPPPPPLVCPQGTHQPEGNEISLCSPIGGGGGNNYNVSSVNGKLVVRFDYTASCACVPDTVQKNLPPKVKCILDKLTNNAVFNNLINAFVSSNYTLNFQVGNTINPTARAETSTRPDLTDPTIDITLNINQVDAMSAASIGEVFIHEAYHAYIDQILIQHNILTKVGFNDTFDNDFDKYIAYQVDSTQNTYLSQGINQNDSRWAQIQHEVMSKNIDYMATGLQSFMQSIHPEIATDPDVSFANYQAYMWQGLIYSQAFTSVWGSTLNQTYNAKKNLLDIFTNPCNP